MMGDFGFDFGGYKDREDKEFNIIFLPLLVGHDLFRIVEKIQVYLR